MALAVYYQRVKGRFFESVRIHYLASVPCNKSIRQASIEWKRAKESQGKEVGREQQAGVLSHLWVGVEGVSFELRRTSPDLSKPLPNPFSDYGYQAPRDWLTSSDSPEIKGKVTKALDSQSLLLPWENQKNEFLKYTKLAVMRIYSFVNKYQSYSAPRPTWRVWKCSNNNNNKPKP
jgi:hypothetical protein